MPGSGQEEVVQRGLRVSRSNRTPGSSPTPTEADLCRRVFKATATVQEGRVADSPAQTPKATRGQGLSFGGEDMLMA